MGCSCRDASALPEKNTIISLPQRNKFSFNFQMAKLSNEPNKYSNQKHILDCGRLNRSVHSSQFLRFIKFEMQIECRHFIHVCMQFYSFSRENFTQFGVFQCWCGAEMLNGIQCIHPSFALHSQPFDSYLVSKSACDCIRNVGWIIIMM